MPLMTVELDPSVLDWVDEIALQIEYFQNDTLLLETALNELQEFYQERFRDDAPKSLRRSLTLIKHLAASFEHSGDELHFLIQRTQTSLEASATGNPLPSSQPITTSKKKT